MESYVGWVALEAGQLVQPQADWNFILFPEPNVAKHGVNCKIPVVTLLTTDLREYMLHGGICRAIVRGTRHTAAVHEAGWSSRSNQYLSVTWMMCEQGPDDEEESIHQDSPNETLLSDDEEMAESDKFEDAAEKTESESMPPATQPPVSPEKDNGNGNMRKRSPEELNGITKKARVEVEESNSNSAT